jgi:hypothetical protein
MKINMCEIFNFSPIDGYKKIGYQAHIKDVYIIGYLSAKNKTSFDKENFKFEQFVCKKHYQTEYLRFLFKNECKEASVEYMIYSISNINKI